MFSFVDTLQHLVDSNRWMLDQLQPGRSVTNAEIQPGDAEGRNWGLLLHDLIALGIERALFIRELGDNQRLTPVDNPALPDTTIWWFLIMRGVLDHEK